MDDPEVNYTLGQKYQGGARRQTKSYGNEKKTFGTPWKDRPNKPRRDNRPGRIQSPGWMRGIKGCFVCVQDHRANTKDKGGKEEVMGTIKT